jgi:hypothetical protein
MTLDAKVNYAKATCGQWFIDYLEPTIFNSLHFEDKQKLLYYKKIN